MEDIEEREKVEARILDWKKRISDVYSTINHWIENSNYSIQKGADVIMYEELMALYSVPSTKLETINILRGNVFVMSVKPKGLWIIGANGRIDLLSITRNVMLVDISKQFENPQWKLYDGNKINGLDFNYETFINLLNKS